MNQGKSICVFGDSISWGAWDEEKGGWVNRLWLTLADHEPYLPLYNLGIDGVTSTSILARFESEAKARNAGMLVFQTGGNDASTGSRGGQNTVLIDDFKKNIAEIIDRAKQITDNIAFLDLKNCDESKTMPVYWGDVYYSNDALMRYSDAMREICKEKGVTFIDVGSLGNDDFEDGLHPNAQGHQKIFERVKESLTVHNWI